MCEWLQREYAFYHYSEFLVITRSVVARRRRLQYLMKNRTRSFLSPVPQISFTRLLTEQLNTHAHTHAHTMTEDGNAIKSLVPCRERRFSARKLIGQENRNENFCHLSCWCRHRIGGCGYCQKRWWLPIPTLFHSTWLASEFHNRRIGFFFFFLKSGPKLTSSWKISISNESIIFFN